MLKINKTLVQRKKAILFEEATDISVDNKQSDYFELLSVMGSYGYTLSTDSFEKICNGNYDVSYLTEIVSNVLYGVTGSETKKGKTFYVNFPIEVKELSDEEIYVNSIVYYMFGLNLSESEEAIRPSLDEKCKLKELKIIDIQEMEGYARELLNSTVSYGDSERSDLEDYFEFIGNSLFLDYEDKTNRENKTYIAYKMKEANYQIVDFKDLLDAPTDVLRFVALLQDQDHSLSSKLKFKSFKRADRRLILELIDKFGDTKWDEDFSRYCGEYKKLVKYIHPFEKKYKYLNAQRQLKKCIDNVKVITFNSTVEKLIKEKNGVALIGLLSTRPSDFARRFGKVSEIVGLNVAWESFNKVSKDVPIHILASMIGYFNGRLKTSKTRMFLPKSLSATVHVTEDTREELSPLEVNSMKLIAKFLSESIVDKIKHDGLSELGNVFIDPLLNKVALPLGLRNANKGSKLIPRYSRLPLGDKNNLRAFIHWVGEDVDLSVSIHDENFKYVDDCSYYNINKPQFGMVHSGDITYAPKGASEYLDVDIEKAIDSGVRYLMMNVYSYSGESFDTIKDCFCGWMLRDNLDKGEIFEAKTVEHKFDLGNKGTNSIPLIVDLVGREIIWCDLSTGSYRPHTNSNEDSVTLETVLEGVVTHDFYTLGELFLAHASARGKIVETREEADIVFDMETMNDFDKIITEYL